MAAVAPAGSAVRGRAALRQSLRAGARALEQAGRGLEVRARRLEGQLRDAGFLSPALEVHVPSPRSMSRKGSVTASAQRFNLKDKKAVRKQAHRTAEWQEESWGYFDDVGEIKYSMWFFGNVMAKLRLYPAIRSLEDPEAPPVPLSDPKSGVSPQLAARCQLELERLKGPLGGLSEIIRELNMNLELAGEAYLVMIGPREVREPGGPGEPEIVTVLPEEWDIKSVSEIVVTDGIVRVKSHPEDSKPVELDKERDDIIRIWQRHPRWSLLPDANMRGVLSDLEALVLLRNQIKAEAKSRMAAGYFTLPNELSTGPLDEGDGEDGEEAVTDPLMQELYDGLVDPVEDPASAAAVAVTFIRGPAEFLHPDFLRHINLGRDSSKELVPRIQAIVETIARGLNLPVETVMGHQSTTFANAAQIKEDQFDEHFEPRCVLCVDGLTVGFYQPNLLAAGVPPELAERICVWFDPAGMVKQTNPQESSDKGHELGALSNEAWRRVNGWTEDDAPDGTELLVRAALRLRTLDPGLTTAIIELLGVPLDIPAELPPTGTAPVAASAASGARELSVERLLAAALQKRALGEPVNLQDLTAELLGAARGPRQEKPGRQLMLIDRELRGRVLGAANASMSRVLERAGNRLRAKAGQTRELVRGTHPQYVAATLGPQLVAAAGFTDDALIDADAFDALEAQFLQWGSHAQEQALDVVNQIIGLSAAERSDLQLRQAGSLTEAWGWMRDQLHNLAAERLYQPDPLAPNLGEFDPTSKVPTGLVRQALSRAGGASGLTVQRGEPFVVLNDGKPPGGIGTGELIERALSDGGALVDAYEWVYGPAFRARPFEDHEVLDGTIFSDFDSDVLSGSPFDANFYPGDHEGCACDVAPLLVPPDTLDD